MRQISSDLTWFHKRAFPTVYLGGLTIFFILGAGLWAREPNPVRLLFAVGPLVVAAGGFLVMRKYLWILVDAAYDCGDYLLIRNRGDEDRVALSNIIHVEVSVNAKPPHITLLLGRACKFGAEISFMPSVGFNLNPFAMNDLADGLSDRAQRARAQRSG